jgi:hypothetical protein
MQVARPLTWKQEKVLLVISDDHSLCSDFWNDVKDKKIIDLGPSF